MFEKIPSFRAITRKASWLLSDPAKQRTTAFGIDDEHDLLGGQAVEVCERLGGNTGVRMKHVEEKVDLVLRNKTQREAILKEAKKQFCEESIRFYLAILEWESISHDMKKREMMAKKLVATFVEEGSEFENGCLSSVTRDDLLLCHEERVDESFFQYAKQEVLNDIWMNPSLKKLVEAEYVALNSKC